MTINELINQLSDVAGVYKTYVRVIPISDAKQIIHEALKKQREIFMREHNMWFNNLQDNREFAEIIENVPEPEL